jgi:hypothetical protein
MYTIIRKMNAEACLDFMLHANIQPCRGTNKTTYMVMSRDQNAGQSHNVRLITDTLKGGTVQTFGNNLNESIFSSGRN